MKANTNEIANNIFAHELSNIKRYADYLSMPYTIDVLNKSDREVILTWISKRPVLTISTSGADKSDIPALLPV